MLDLGRAVVGFGITADKLVSVGSASTLACFQPSWAVSSSLAKKHNRLHNLDSQLLEQVWEERHLLHEFECSWFPPSLPRPFCLVERVRSASLLCMPPAHRSSELVGKHSGWNLALLYILCTSGLLHF